MYIDNQTKEVYLIGRENPSIIVKTELKLEYSVISIFHVVKNMFIYKLSLTIQGEDFMARSINLPSNLPLRVIDEWEPAGFLPTLR